MPQTLYEVEKRYLEKQMQHGKTIHLGNFSGNKKNILKIKIQKMECSLEAMKKRNNIRTKHVSNLKKKILTFTLIQMLILLILLISFI